jgi:ABC-2 type transport system permease protein
MMEQACSLRDPLSLISIPMFNPMGGYASYLIPAVFILLLQQTLLVGIGLLSGTEKENKTNENSKYQDLSIISIISGKACAYFSIYMIHIAYLFGILFKFYHFPLNATPLSLILFLIPYLFACIFLGQAISYFFKTREMSMVILLFSSMPAIFLSGFAWPKFSMPAWLNHIAILLPSTCGIEGFLKISQTGASLKDIGYDWMVLIILTIIYFILAVIAMKNQYRTTSNSQSTI